MPSTRGKKKVSYKEEHSSDEENPSDEDFDDDNSDDEKIQKKSKKIKKAAPAKKAKKPTKDEKKKEEKKKEQKKKGKGKGKKKDSDEEDDEEEEEEKGSDSGNPLLKKKEKKPDTSKLAGYTTDQHAKYKELLVELKKYTNDQLKDMLRKNDQAVGGTKDVLIDRVADGKVLGKIPRCPKCFGGKPKFDNKTGLYKCPGFQDDADFRFCNKKYSLDELQRETWQD